jgi:hypothetical protein
MISPPIAGNDSRCGVALRVFLGELSAMSCQYPYPNRPQREVIPRSLTLVFGGTLNVIDNEVSHGRFLSGEL